MGRYVGQKWPQKIGYHLWMAPNGFYRWFTSSETKQKQSIRKRQ